jgi:N-acetylglucosamine malate deacetylase 2
VNIIMVRIAIAQKNERRAVAVMVKGAARLLAVFAHPDDEVFRCGGTLALLAQRRVGVHILTFTRGQAGSCGQPPVCTPEELGAVRITELLCSCRALGLEAPQVLDYEDGKLEEISEEEGVARIADCIRSIHPQVLLTWPLHGLSGHPDHVAVSRWTLAAYQQAKRASVDDLAALYHLAMPESLAKELGMTQLHTLPDEEITVTVDVQNVWEQKMAAIACHYTQAGESPILRAPLERQKRFLGREHFYRAFTNKPDDVLLKMN